MFITRFLNLLILTLLLAIVGTLSISYFQSKQTKVTEGWVEHTRQVLMQCKQIQFTVIENENSTRGYSITGRQDFERTSDSTGEKMIKDVADLRKLIDTNASIQALLDSLQYFVALRNQFSDTLRQRYRQEGRLAALTLITNGRGLHYSRGAIACLEQIQLQEEHRHQNAKNKAEHSFLTQQKFLLITLMILLVLAGAMTFKFKKEFQEQQRYRRKILLLNRDLEQKVEQRTAELEHSKKQLEDIFYRISDAFIALDRNWQYTYLNKNAEQLLGVKKENMLGKVIWDIYPDIVGNKTWQAFQDAMEKQVPLIIEDYYAPLNLWYENRIYPSPDGLSVVISDISERKKLEAKLQIIQRMFLFISQVNQSLVRVNNEEELMQEVCKIAVEVGGFVMAWVGRIDEHSGQLLNRVHAGNESGYLGAVNIHVNENQAEGKGPTGRSIRSGHYAVCNDIEHDDDFKPWREAALQRGYRSSIAFPLKVGEKTVGAFSVYAGEKYFFNEEEIRLLEEASRDIAFGLERFDIDRRRRAAEMTAQRERELANSLIDNMPGTVALYDSQHRILRWNRNLETLTGLDGESIQQMQAWRVIYPDDHERFLAYMARVLQEGSSSIQISMLSRDGEKKPYYISGRRIEYEGEPCILGIGIDLSDQVKAQQELLQTTEQLHLLSRHLLEVREQERKRIGREIHDELGQQLTAIKLDISWIERHIGADDPLQKKMLEVIGMLNSSNQAIRRILHELRPSLLDDYGLEEALQALNTQFSAQTGVPVKFSLTGRPDLLPEPVTTCIYRVYQEALTNITRHAQATRVITRVEIGNNILIFRVKDDGAGFLTDQVNRKTSFGIVGMRERVAAVNGYFSIHSEPGQGTDIFVRIQF